MPQAEIDTSVILAHKPTEIHIESLARCALRNRGEVFFAVRAVLHLEKLSAQLRQNALYRAFTLIQPLHSLANATPLTADMAQAQDEIGKILTIEGAVNIAQEWSQILLRCSHRKVERSIIHHLDHTARTLNNRFAVAPRNGSREKACNLLILGALERVGNAYRVGLDKFGTIVPIVERFEQIASELKKRGISVKIDDRDNVRPGFKFAEYELKGVPVRLVLGARDIENGTIEVMRRDTLEKETRQIEGIVEYVKELLDDIQKNLHSKALAMREASTRSVETYEEFKTEIEKGGFILAHWDGTPETEEQIKNETKATIRCIPLGWDETPGTCMVTGKPSARRVLFARAY